MAGPGSSSAISADIDDHHRHVAAPQTANQAEPAQAGSDHNSGHFRFFYTHL
jgi:hypothetical protein